MTTRNCRFELRLSRNELSDLTKKARKARLTNAGFIRRAIRDQEVKEAPPVDVPILIHEVRRVGYNIDQVLKIARAQDLVDVPQLRKALEENRELVRQITNIYAMAED